MKNLIYYLKTYGDKDFHELPFNEMDSLMLNQLCYCNLEFVSTDPEVPFSLNNLCDSGDYKALSSGSTTYLNNVKMLPLFRISTRYKDITFSYIRSQNDEDTQFFAVTFFVPLPEEEIMYVAFRGTDTRISGWKEDGDMFVHKLVPSQPLARDYLNEVMKKEPYRCVVGGHSKGANLAIYSSSYCTDTKRILWIDDFDGPGFSTEEVYQTEGYQQIASKLRCYSAYYSVVAMMLYHPEKVTFIKSNGLGVLQHDPYSWYFDEKNMCLARTPKSAMDSEGFNIAVKKLLTETTEEERKLLIDTFFTLLADKDSDELKDLIQNPFTYSKSVNERKKLLPEGVYEEYKKIVRKVVKAFQYGQTSVLKKNINNLVGMAKEKAVRTMKEAEARKLLSDEEKKMKKEEAIRLKEEKKKSQEEAKILKTKIRAEKKKTVSKTKLKPAPKILKTKVKPEKKTRPVKAKLNAK